MLDDNTKNAIKEKLKEMQDPVKLIFFKTKRPNSEYCDTIDSLLNELNELSEKLSVESYSLESDSSKAQKYEVEHAPVIITEGKEKRFVRYFGIPTGYEFTPFLQTILDASKGGPEIANELKEKIKAIDFPVHIKVFVSPACPYCSGAMKVAHDFALLNQNIKGDVYEVNGFMEIAAKYNVMGVPKTVINESVELVGAYPPDIVLQKIASLKK